MTLLDDWIDLERRLPPGQPGQMVRRILPNAVAEIRITAQTEGRRGLELLVDRRELQDVEVPTATQAVRLDVDDAGPEGALRLTLTEVAAGELFAALCEDVATATARAGNESEAVSVWLGRFSRWKRLLRSGPGGLSPKRQRGLYAELWAVRDLLSRRVGLLESVEAWKGPDGAPRDFETSGIGIETKSSAANEPQVVTVNGERQLDDNGLDALYLVHLSLEVLRDAGETLPAIVTDIRGQFHGGPAEDLFEDRLIESGFADAHARLYARTGYEIRRISVFDVRDGFPRIVEQDLSDGVGRVHYGLAIDVCRDEFEVDQSVLTDRLGPLVQ